MPVEKFVIQEKEKEKKTTKRRTKEILLSNYAAEGFGSSHIENNADGGQYFSDEVDED